MNSSKFQAVLDMFEAGFPTHLLTSCQAWDDLTCDEQMYIDAHTIEIFVEQ
jgi:hypothetical protein|tara:strand:- start:468 stop:620 length:153 start_codon:yes stop_codon:yes gene_type:complete